MCSQHRDAKDGHSTSQRHIMNRFFDRTLDVKKYNFLLKFALRYFLSMCCIFVKCAIFVFFLTYFLGPYNILHCMLPNSPET